MTTWFTADTHFGHIKIVEYQPNRMVEFGLTAPDQIDEMNESIVAAWNSQVAPGDTVYHLGDFAMGQIDKGLEYVSRLNGDIILVMGNHDRPHPCRGQVGKVPEWEDRYLAAGFADLCLERWYEFDGIPVIMNHFPYTGDHMMEPRYMDWRPTDTGQVLLHGHIHGLWQIDGRQVNVGMDAHGGRLLGSDEVADLVYRAALN